MMDELVNSLAAKTGMSQEQSREAVEHVVAFLKTKLPAPLAGALDSYMGGEGGESGGFAGEAEKLIGGFFSKGN